jgi:hypothetical protein
MSTKAAYIDSDIHHRAKVIAASKSLSLKDFFKKLVEKEDKK